MDILLLRPAQITRPILDVLNVLTDTQKLSLGEARNIVTLQLKNCHMSYVGYVDGEAVCFGSVIILVKLGRNGGKSALIEDVSVREDMQGKGYGLRLVKFLVKKAKSYNVYKILLNCTDDLVPFYEKAGFKRCGNCMRMDIE